MWTKIRVQMDFTVPLCGGTPRNDDIVKQWVELRAASEAKHRRDLRDGVGPDARKPVDLATVVEERLETTMTLDVADEMDKVWVGFSRDGKGLFVRGANLRAHFKDAAQVLGSQFKKENGAFGMKQVKNFKSKIVNHLYIMEERLYLEDAGGNVYKEPTSYRDATMTVMTAQGPRTCLKRVDMVEPCTIRATLQFMEGSEIVKDHIKKLFEYGQVHGFGQDRSLQFGRYSFTIDEV